MKNGSFDLAFRTMTIGLLMFLVLSIVSVGIHNIRPNSGSQFGPMAGNGNPAAQSPRVDDSARATDDIRREFASSLARVSDRLAGIEQRFTTLTPSLADVPTADEARLQSAIDTTHRRLELLGDRLTDRIQSVSVASEVELRDLNRQLTHLLDEQQQIQEQMVSVRVASENRLRPTRLAQVRPEENSGHQNSGRQAEARQTRQNRLTQNLEAMVTELASLREQLQAVRTAAADIAPDNARSSDERLAVSLKVPQDSSPATEQRDQEDTVDRPVPEPTDLDVMPKSEPPATKPATKPDDGAASVSAPASLLPEPPAKAKETIEDSIELPQADLPALPGPTASPAESSGAAAASFGPATAAPQIASRKIDSAATDNSNWQVPIAARPVSTIFPTDQRPGKSTQTPRGQTLPTAHQPATKAAAPSATRSSADGDSAIRISLPAPAPAPLEPQSAEPTIPTPGPFPAIVAEIVEPADPAPQPVIAEPAPLTPQEPRRIGRDIPANAQRAPLRLADAPVVRPFEVPTRESKTVPVAAASDSAKSESPFSRFALTSSDSSDEPKRQTRGVTNAKWRAARDQSGSDARPALRNSRSLFPIFNGKSGNNAASPAAAESNAADSQIPQPLPLPQNLIESSAATRVSAPALIDQVGAELAGPQRTFSVQTSVLHITADDLTTVDRAGVKTLAVMGGHDFRVNQIRHAVRASDSADEIYSGLVTVTGGIPTRIPIGWLCSHCNEESGVTNGDQLVVTLPHHAGDNSAAFYVEQADGTGRSESFRDTKSLLIPGASVQITEAAQDGTVETDDATRTPVLSRLPVIGGKFDKKSTQRRIMQRIIVLTIREVRASNPQPIQQLSGERPATGSKVVHAGLTAPATTTTRRQTRVHDSSGATTTNAGLRNRQPAPPVEG